jgi:hypothetical protein
MRKWEGKKPPRRDGIGLGFFIANWGAVQSGMLDLFTQMFANGTITDQQKVGS